MSAWYISKCPCGKCESYFLKGPTRGEGRMDKDHALLCSAAPEMLEALEDIKTALGDRDTMSPQQAYASLDSMATKVLRVIAKSRGENT